jgi:hypothetical protein
MPRTYTVSFENVAITAAQDLVACKGSTGKVCEVNRVWFGPTDTTLQTAQGLRLNIKYSSATLTLGSGGTAPTPQPVDPGDAAASFTAHVNDTTQATTSGAFTNRFPIGKHNYNDVDFPLDKPIYFGLNEGVIFELLSTVSGTCHFSGGMEITEYGS